MKTFPTIASFLTSIGRPFEQDFDCTVHRFEELHGDATLESPSFRTAYFAFIFVEVGQGEYTIDGRTFPLGPGDYYFTNPGHVKSFRIREPIRGYILTFTDAYLQAYHNERLVEEFPFLYHSTTPVLRLAGKEDAGIHQTFANLLRTYGETNTFRAKLLALELASLLYRTKGLLDQYRDRLTPGSRAEELALTFRRQLNDRFRAANGGRITVPRVSDLAENMAVTPAHLSEVVRAATGQTPKHWITDRLLAEARSLLLNDPAPVAAIADRLGYDDASNFSRFFKRHVGLTPRQYRKSDGKVPKPKN